MLTASPRYCVRPNSGRIEPNGEVEVQVLLQAMKEDPPPDARCRDKFLVQSVAISPDRDANNVSQIWAGIEQTAKSSIQEKKIRVNFLPADGGHGLSSTAANGVSHHDEEQPPAYGSPTPLAVTPQRPSHSSASDYNKSPEQDFAPSNSTFGSATAAVSNATGIPEADLQRKLDEANATISRLQTQAAEATGLRQRKTAGDTATTEKSGPVTALQSPSGGVPVQIVAALCLLSFLIAYFLF